MPRALITGISGQDGSYLAELLLEKGYEVWGMVRRSTNERFPLIEHIRSEIRLVQGDMLDQMTLLDAVSQARPHELYNLAATSFVPASWKQPVMTAQFTAVGVTSMLEAIRIIDPHIRLYQASSSEIFGATNESPQSETTPFKPHTPYGVAKLYGHLMVASYRERYGMHASSGILYNHESPRRPADFVTRKVTRAAAEIKLGLANELRLGDLNATRDWAHARDVVESHAGVAFHQYSRLRLADVHQPAHALLFGKTAEQEHPDAEENEHRDEPGQKGGQKRIVDGPRNRNAPAGKLLGELRIDAIGDEELSAVDWLL